ncbi:MAG: hypothetical protein ACW7DR_20325 [Paraglaciecola chathamensis]
MNLKSILLISFVLISSASFAGFSSYESFSNSGGVVAPLVINEKGLFNLVVSVQFIREPYEKSPYDSDEYHSLISRLNLEWQGVAIQKILETPSISPSDLSKLKVSIESSINELIKIIKPKYLIKENVEVVFSIDNFYLVEVSSN